MDALPNNPDVTQICTQEVAPYCRRCLYVETPPDTCCPIQIAARKGQSWNKHSLKQIWTGKQVKPEDAVTSKATVIQDTSLANMHKDLSLSRTGSQISSTVTRPAIPGPFQPAPSPTIPKWSKQGRHGDGSQLQLDPDHQASSCWWARSKVKLGSQVRVRHSPVITKQVHCDKAHPKSRQEQSQQVRDHPSKVHSQALAWLARGSSSMHSYNITQTETRSSSLSLNGVTGPTSREGSVHPRWGWSGPLRPVNALRASWLPEAQLHWVEAGTAVVQERKHMRTDFSLHGCSLWCKQLKRILLHEDLSRLKLSN